MTIAAETYQAEIEEWRAQMEARLRAEDGWLSLAGLFWLHEGSNSVGSDPGSDIVLPGGAAHLGRFLMHNGEVMVELVPGAQASINGQPALARALRSSAAGAPDLIQAGDLTMFLHHSGARRAIRLRDRNSPARRDFAGRRWFPVQEDYRISATWTPYDPPRQLTIVNIVGDVSEQASPGYVTFVLDGQECRLDATQEPRQLALHFHDRSSGQETYPGGRFLKAALPEHGRVILDFNRAYNPPCAFTSFATCPQVPPQNRLPVRIAAGERWLGHTATSDA